MDSHPSTSARCGFRRSSVQLANALTAGEASAQVRGRPSHQDALGQRGFEPKVGA